ncbi:MAG: hypothetical protein ACSHWW_08825 [Nonlabens sp.]|uniref:hypothetical protein n=1 Tax=Nonlabens sp. TaxID=1888209 RepID=UPI003EF6186A
MIKNKITIICAFLFSITILFSCSVHQRSYVESNEEFVVEVKRPSSRGSLVEVALQGLFIGADYLAEKTAQSLTSSYSQSLSINDYYSNDGDAIAKSYEEIVIKKYAAVEKGEKEKQLVTAIENDIKAQPQSRGSSAAFSMKDVMRASSTVDEKDELLNFEARIAIESDPENPGVSRLSFNELRILFSRTKVYEDEDLNAQLSVSIEGHWRSADNTPMHAILIEQEYDLRDLKYGVENQIENPIVSPWYYDIPYLAENEDFENYGVVQINVQLREYEGGKSKYINKLPSILSDNKDAVIKQGSATIQKVLGN